MCRIGIVLWMLIAITSAGVMSKTHLYNCDYRIMAVHNPYFRWGDFECTMRHHRRCHRPFPKYPAIPGSAYQDENE
ncbi:MAG: hypothetical protein C5S48_09500 [Candidatus Methanogaster sp.]|nr:MAG: hypothetical protein C5S48_09500 [ANME-2 cluster archaeon]